MENFELWLAFVVLSVAFVGSVSGFFYSMKKGKEDTEHYNDIWDVVPYLSFLVFVVVSPILFETAVRLFGTG